MMKKLALAAVSLWLAFASPALATNVNIDGLPAATSVTGTSNLFECEQGGTNNQCTSVQIAAYIYGLMNGDATASGTGGITFATVNSNVGTFGSATTSPSVIVNGKGLITAASSVTITPAVGSITGLGTGVSAALAIATGTAGSFVVNGGALGTPSSATLTNATGLPLAGITGFGTGVATALAIAPGTTGSFPTQDGAITTGNCLKWGPGVQDAGAACGSGGSTTITAGTTPTSGFTNGHFVQSNGSVVQDATAVTSVGAGCGTSTGGSAITTTGTVSAQINSRAVTTTTDTIVNTDCGNIVYANDASAIAGTIAQAGTTGFASGSYFEVCNINAGAYTLTPTTSTIGGASTLVINAGTAANPNCVPFKSDGTNYNLMDTVKGSGVQAAMAAALNGSGGLLGQSLIGTSGATLPLLNGNNTFSGAQTFGEVIGTVTTQSGTTYTFAATDCGTTVRFTSTTTVTATIPQGLPVGCSIAVAQISTGQVKVNGSAVTPATLLSAHSYTGTFNAAGAIIGLFDDATNHVILTGDGA